MTQTIQIRESPSGPLRTFEIAGGIDVGNVGVFHLTSTFSQARDTVFLAASGGTIAASAENGANWSVDDAASGRIVYNGTESLLVEAIWSITGDSSGGFGLNSTWQLSKNGAGIGVATVDMSTAIKMDLLQGTEDSSCTVTGILRIDPGDTLQLIALVTGSGADGRVTFETIRVIPLATVTP